MADKAKETVIIARVEKSPGDVEAILRSLGSWGLEVEVINSENPRDFRERLIVQDRVYSIDEIISEEQFLAREHFSEFGQMLYGDHFSERIAGQAFKAIINPSISRGSRRRFIPPKELGLMVCKRKEVDLPPYLGGLSGNYPRAVQAASFLDYMDRKGQSYAYYEWEKFLGSLSGYLRNRLELAPSSVRKY